MKQGWIAALVMALALGAGADIAEAKRLGSGGSLGMQRSMPAKSAPNSAPNATPNNAPGQPAQNAAPAQQAAPAAAPGAAGAATPPKRNWMGPIAGLAAGLGLAALLSHFGLGEAFASMMMTVLLVVAAVALVMFLVRRFAKPRGAAAQPAYAMAGAGAGAGSFEPAREPVQATPREVYRDAAASAPMARDSVAASFGGSPGSVADSFAAPVAAAPAVSLPADFDAAAFQRIARMIFIRMQTANDRGDLNDLRSFTTPEVYAHLQLDLQDRRNAPQQTEVLDIAAEVLDLAREAERDIVSVRYLGRVREEAGGPEVAVDEIWHLVREAAEPQAWRIAGIQQTQ